MSSSSDRIRRFAGTPREVGRAAGRAPGPRLGGRCQPRPAVVAPPGPADLGRTRPGRPHLSGWVLLTDMLETCSTIGDVEARLGEVDRDEGMLLFAVDGKSDEFAILECACSRVARRAPTEPWLVGTNHACALGRTAPADSSESRHTRMEAMATDLYAREARVDLPADLTAILADDHVERRGQNFATVYANVGCPATGALWFTFGGHPAASRGEWLPIAWPW